MRLSRSELELLQQVQEAQGEGYSGLQVPDSVMARRAAKLCLAGLLIYNGLQEVRLGDDEVIAGEVAPCYTLTAAGEALI